MPGSGGWGFWQPDAVQVRKVGRVPAPARLIAVQLAWTCCALVAPNSTLVTTGLVSGNTIASAAAVVSSLLARLASSSAAATAGATRESASVPAARPAAGPDRYLPVSTPPARQNEATTPAPADSSTRVMAGSSTQERRTRL